MFIEIFDALRVVLLADSSVARECREFYCGVETEKVNAPYVDCSFELLERGHGDFGKTVWTHMVTMTIRSKSREPNSCERMMESILNRLDSLISPLPTLESSGVYVDGFRLIGSTSPTIENATYRATMRLGFLVTRF